MTRLFVTVTGMDCTGCEQRIQAALRRLDGVEGVEADHVTDSVIVDYDPTAVQEPTLRQRLQDAGYEPIRQDDQL